MCTNFRPPGSRIVRDMQGFGGVQMPPGAWPDETYPGYAAPIVTPSATGAGLVCSLARFGLVPRWSRDAQHAGELSRRTTNARSETVAEKPSFRSPWRERRYALVPMQSYYEPCWETGRALRWRISLASGEPFAVAGLHERWTDNDTGQTEQSFTLLTVNADGHPLMGRMHRPTDEKRMLVIVPPALYGHWLQATPEQAAHLLGHPPDPALAGEPAPREVLATPVVPVQGALDF
jgi:putative SOS response-associated peptidase YedK